MIDKALRVFVPDQIKALVEKIETNDFDARSLQKLKHVISELDLTRLERYVVRRAYSRMKRLRDMDRIMEEIIIGDPVQTPEQQYDMARDINAKLRHAMDSGVYTGAAAAQQNGMWNGITPQEMYRDAPVKEEGKRVIVRPKVKAL